MAESQDPSLRVPEGRADEVGGLARGMNRMLARLEDAQGRLRATLGRAAPLRRRRVARDAHARSPPCAANIEILGRHDLPPGRARGDARRHGDLGGADGPPGGGPARAGPHRRRGPARRSAWTWARWSARSRPARSATGVEPGVVGDRRPRRAARDAREPDRQRPAPRRAGDGRPSRRRTAQAVVRGEPTTGRASPATTASASSTASTAPPAGAARPAPASACRSPARPPSAGAGACGCCRPGRGPASRCACPSPEGGPGGSRGAGATRAQARSASTASRSSASEAGLSSR